MKIRKQGLMLFFLSLMLCLTACNKEIVMAPMELKEKESVSGEESRPLRVVVNLDEGSDELILENAWLNRSRFIGGLLFRGLLIAEENINNIQPDLCSEYTISPDGLTYVFRLKDNIYWHDGNKVTLEDVKWSIETCLLSPSVNGYLKNGLQRIEGSKEYEAGKASSLSGLMIKDEHLIIRITERDDSFLSELAQLAILPSHYFKGMETSEIEVSDFWQSPIGNGPYKFKERISNKEIILEANQEYDGDLPLIKEISCVVLDNPKEEYFDFGMTSDPEIVEKYRKDSRYRVVRSNNLYYRYLMFNVDGNSGKLGSLLKNTRVRKALIQGLDRQSIINDIYKDTAVVLDTGIEKDSSWYLETKTYRTDYDPESAKAILEEEDFDFEEPLVLTRYHHDEISVRLLEAVADCWRKLGIKIEIIPINPGDTDKLWTETEWYHVALKNLAAVDYSEWYYEYSSDNHLWSNILKDRTEFDQLIHSLNRSNWAYQRNEVYLQLQRLELSCVYKIPLASIPQYVIYNKEHLEIPLEEFPNLWYYFDLDIEDWKVKG
ncbi:MAG: ABC transporter substrate-binding protein [Lachnospiraceae bacterium]|nr:ABC transporter substrate-binding protein [Lachnospiraceae bacterium]